MLSIVGGAAVSAIWVCPTVCANPKSEVEELLDLVAMTSPIHTLHIDAQVLHTPHAYIENPMDTACSRKQPKHAPILREVLSCLTRVRSHANLAESACLELPACIDSVQRLHVLPYVPFIINT